MDNKQQIIEELIKQEPEESTNAWFAFLFWVGLPISERNSDAKAMQKTAAYVGLELSTITVYRVNYRWDERAKLIEAHLFKLQFDDRRKAMEADNLQFASDTKEIQTKAIAVAKKLLNIAEQLADTVPLSNKVLETDYVKALQPDGSTKTVPTTTQIIMKAEVKDIAPLVRVAIDTPLKVMGLPTEVVQPEVVRNVAEIPQMSDDDITEQRRLIALEKEKYTGKTQNISGIQ